MNSFVDLSTLFASLAALPEWRMREHRIESVLDHLSAFAVVQLVERIIVATRCQRSLVSPGYMSLLKVAVRWERDQDRRLSQWLQEAVDHGYFWSAAFFSRPVDPPIPSKDRLAGADAALAALTLGERKAALRKVRDDRALEKYFPFDHPQMVEILLRQPRMNEKLMIRYAAQRPLPEAAALGICLSEHWIHYPSILDALVLNPSLPQWLALKLMPICSRSALDDLLAEPGEGRSDLRLWAARLKGSEEKPGVKGGYNKSEFEIGSS